jgi:protein subunit release factor A
LLEDTRTFPKSDRIGRCNHPFHNKEIPMKCVLEIRGAEGGEDAKLFAKDLAAAYGRLFSRFG